MRACAKTGAIVGSTLKTVWENILACSPAGHTMTAVGFPGREPPSVSTATDTQPCGPPQTLESPEITYSGSQNMGPPETSHDDAHLSSTSPRGADTASSTSDEETQFPARPHAYLG